MDTPSTKYLSNDIREQVRRIATESGFSRCGFAVAAPVDAAAVKAFDDWIAAGKHGCLSYLEKYRDVRNDPRLLLDGAATIIAVALNYLPREKQQPQYPQIAYYAYGDDYHEVVRNRLAPVVDYLATLGASARICVDTAPLRERYWAQQAGLGFIGMNNQLIIPSLGSYHFLGFVITTAALQPDEPCISPCISCRRCLIYCPTKAISDHGAIDARRCLSCLTIEHRGEIPEGISLGNRLYGCDTCQKACPHNIYAPTTEIPEFTPIPERLTLTVNDILEMDQERYAALFRHSAIKRAKLAALHRNAAHLHPK